MRELTTSSCPLTYLCILGHDHTTHNNNNVIVTHNNNNVIVSRALDNYKNENSSK